MLWYLTSVSNKDMVEILAISNRKMAHCFFFPKNMSKYGTLLSYWLLEIFSNDDTKQRCKPRETRDSKPWANMLKAYTKKFLMQIRNSGC